MALKTAYWFDDTYKVNVILAWGGTVHDLNKWMETNNQYGIKATPPSDGLEGRVIAGTNGYLVYIAPNSEVDILHHECIHLAMFIFEDRGVEVEAKNHEHLTYYSGMWFKKFYAKLKRSFK